MNRYSAIYFQDRVTLPRELLAEMVISPLDAKLASPSGQRVSLEYENAKLLIRKLANGENGNFEARVNQKGSIIMPEKLRPIVKANSGDVLDLKFDGETLEIEIFDKNSVPDQMFYANDIDGVKAPPGWICMAFTANPSSQIYVRSGHAAVKNFDSHLSKHGVDYRNLENILDFGCGAGRVISSFNASCEANLFGIDLHKDAIEWCQSNLSYGTFEFGQERPPLTFQENQFDFIYAISVFTHLNETMQDAWLAELKRIAAPGATLILSYRAEDYISEVLQTARGRKILDELKVSGGFFFEEHTRWDGIFPTYYCDAFHTHEYIRERWGSYFEILELIPTGGFSNKQNAAVLRNSLP